MKIQKKYQGAIPLNRIANERNESEINTYSTKYINGINDNLNAGLIALANNTKFKVLWSNPNPEASFEGQDIIVIDDTPYEYILLVFDGYAPYENFGTYIFKKPSKDYQLPYGCLLWNGSGLYLEFRERYIRRNSNTSYTFWDGKINGATNNDVAVPVKILGFNLTTE
jgi:hypothetical protein